jgi:fibronectin type 3 domain-containing protein
VAGNSFTDTSPSVGVNYDYIVTALGPGGESAVSDIVTATPLAPSAPTVTAVNQTHVDVAVLALAGGAVSYDVQRAPDVSGAPGSWATVDTGATPSAAFHDSGLTVGTTYWYRLVAVNSGGGTAPGASRSATTMPTDTTAPAYASSVTSGDGTYIDVTFTEAGSPPLLPATGVTGFTVKANGAARGIASAVRHAATVIRLTLASPVSRWDVVTVEYDAGTGNVTDSAS